MKWQYFVVTSKDCPDHFGGERKENAVGTREEIRYYTQKKRENAVDEQSGFSLYQPTKRDSVLQNIFRLT